MLPADAKGTMDLPPTFLVFVSVAECCGPCLVYRTDPCVYLARQEALLSPNAPLLQSFLKVKNASIVS